MRKSSAVFGILLCGLAALPWTAQAQANDAGALLRQTERDRKELLPPPSPASQPLSSVPAPGVVAPGDDATRVQVQTFILTGNRLQATPDLLAVLAPWTHRACSLPELRQAATAIEQFYRDAGWLAQVNLPAQDVSAGEVRLTIVEARFGTITLTPDSANVAPALVEQVKRILELAMPTGQPLNLRQLERSLLVASELPGLAVNGSLQAGTVPGSTDLLLNLASTERRWTEIAADNGGNRSTGAGRLNAQVTGDSLLFHRGERMSLGLSLTEGSQYLGADGSMPVPLASLADWRMGLHASALAYGVLPSMNISTGLPPRGHTEVLGVRADYPVVRTPLAALTLKLGYDDRYALNQADTQGAGQLADTSATRAGVFSMGLAGSRLDHVLGGGSSQASISLNIGRLSLAGSPASYIASDATGANTQGRYTVWRWVASRLQTLTPDLSLFASASGQFASRNLDSAEKLYLGGMNGVRAYPSGEAGGSQGWIGSLELRKQVNNNWLASVFVDQGQVRQFERNQRADGKGALVAGNRVTLKGVGLGLEFRGDQGQLVKAGFAHRIGTNPLATHAGTDSDGSLVKNRVWINASVAF